ncbi:hypothetical protein Tco_0815411 [Tanacetum coccineum]
MALEDVFSPNDLWVKAVKAFHDHEGGFDNNGYSFKGCGTRICFWKDIWVGEAPLFTRYNHLYRLDQDKDCLIIDRINNGQWHWNWSKTNLGVRNLAYFHDMLNEIGQVNIEVSEDTCVWSLGAKDDVKSPLSKLHHWRRLKTGSSLGMLLNKRNTGSTSFLLRFFGVFGDTEIRQIDLILDGLAEVPSIDCVPGQ